jgi:hypothetical protein
MSNELRDFAAQVAGDKTLLAAVTSDPVGEIKKAAARAELPDTKVYWIITSFVGAIGSACIGGIIALAVLGKPIPEGIVALASAMGGGLVGALTPTPKG